MAHTAQSDEEYKQRTKEMISYERYRHLQQQNYIDASIVCSDKVTLDN